MKVDGIGYFYTYPGVNKHGFSSTYNVIGNNVIVAMSNTYNNNDFTLLWPYRNFTKGLLLIIG